MASLVLRNVSPALLNQSLGNMAWTKATSLTTTPRLSLDTRQFLDQNLLHLEVDGETGSTTSPVVVGESLQG